MAVLTEVHVTREHVVVDPSANSTRLRPSAYLKRQLGSAKFSLRGVGERISAGAAFGFAWGAQQSCHLYAPVELTILRADEVSGEVEVRVHGDFEPGLMTDHEYRSRFSL